MGADRGIKLQEAHSLRDPLDRVIALAAEHLLARQNQNGVWTERFDTGLMADAQTLISLALLKVVDREWTDPLLSRLLSQQRVNGSWSVHPEQSGNLSTTVECYYALTLYDGWPSAERERRARRFILNHGGVRSTRNLTKVFLAVGGEIPWSWLPSPRVYSWLFSNWSPVSIQDVVTFTRLHVAPMLLLSANHFTAGNTKAHALQSLMDENALRELSRRNLHRPHSRVLHVHLARCLDWLLEQRENDGTLAGYHSANFLALFAFRAAGVPQVYSQEARVLHSIRSNLHFDATTGDVHQQTCNAHVWNTALALQALAGLDDSLGEPGTVRAIQYLLSRQHRSTSAIRPNTATLSSGGWGFSDNNSAHPDNDDTVACLEALHPYRDHVKTGWARGVEHLLRMQNRDGGWSAFDKDCAKRWLEWIPANDMKRTMTDPSSPDITGRVLAFLLRRHVVRSEDVRTERAVRWLCSHQERDGSWFGRWGTTFIYGTWCVQKALVLVESPEVSRARTRGLRWLLSVQHPDGSFGESSASEIQGYFVTLDHGTPTHTAWALDALLALYEYQHLSGRDRIQLFDAANRAAAWLMQRCDDGTWTEEFPTGSAFAGDLHIRYHIYPKVWPLLALRHYQQVLTNVPEGG